MINIISFRAMGIVDYIKSSPIPAVEVVSLIGALLALVKKHSA